MPASRRVRTPARTESSRLPDWAAHAVCMLQALASGSRLAGFGERVRANRQGGYAALDVLIGLVVFFASGLKLGLRPFWETACRPFAAQLAAAADRRTLPSSSALSRALGKVTSEEVRKFGPWLLRQMDGFEDVLDHPASRHVDTRGDAFHVFDFDHTVTTFYQRRLTSTDSQPDGSRRAHAATPGYSGRKRGDVQLSRATLQHAGSGLWLDARIGPGNGDQRADFEHAVQVLVEVCKELNLDPSRAVLRGDGAFGHVPHITACLENGISFVSRLARYQVLDQPEVRARLQEAAWYEVPGTVEPSVRFAAEVGLVTLPPSAKTLRADGSTYPPVTARVVVTRRRNGPGVASWGHVIGEWRYELFVTNLDAGSWPAPELVELYAGRSAIENRFAQEDRELELDRVFSYSLGGQELATLAGLFVWNFDVVAGFRLEAERLATYEPKSVERTPRQVQHDLSLGGSERTEAPPTATVDAGDLVTENAIEDEIRACFLKLDLTAELAKRPGWALGASPGYLRCPAGVELAPGRITPSPTGKPGLRFKARTADCRACPLRPTCIGSETPTSAKIIRISLPPAVAEALQGPLAQMKRLARAAREAQQTLDTGRPSVQLDQPVGSPLIVEPLPLALAGARKPVKPRFAPSSARKRFTALCAIVEAHVSVSGLEAPKRASTSLLRPEDERRQTWPQRNKRNALPAHAEVHLELRGAGPLEPLLHGTIRN